MFAQHVDELQADGPACPFEDRARAVMRVVNRHADRTGKKAMYAFNLTGDLDEMRRRHDLLVGLGATCLMASLNSVGLVGMLELAAAARREMAARRFGARGWTGARDLPPAPDAHIQLAQSETASTTPRTLA